MLKTRTMIIWIRKNTSAEWNVKTCTITTWIKLSTSAIKDMQTLLGAKYCKDLGITHTKIVFCINYWYHTIKYLKLTGIADNYVCVILAYWSEQKITLWATLNVLQKHSHFQSFVYLIFSELWSNAYLLSGESSVGEIPYRLDLYSSGHWCYAIEKRPVTGGA